MNLKTIAVMAALGAGLLIPAWADVLDVSPTLEQRIPPDVLPPDQHHFVTLNVENDMFGGNSDRHYTSGVRLTYFDVLDHPPAWAEALARALPGFDVTDKTGVAYSIGQNIYTPDNIRVAHPAPGQRPYAGYLYGSAAFSTLVGDHVDDYQVTLGVVGPSALGEQAQTFVHRIVGSPKPQGWDAYQLHDEPALTLMWQRRYPDLLTWEDADWHLGVEPRYGVTLGNVYTYGSAGATVQFGPASSRWQDLPPLVAPSLSGSGFFATPKGQPFSWYVFAGVEGRAVARNIFLDGNTFRSSPHVEKRILVGDATAGLATTFGRVRVTYTVNHRSREYRGQPKPDTYGAVTLGYRF